MVQMRRHTLRPDQVHRLRHEGEAAASRYPALLAEAERIATSVMHGTHGRRRPGSGETFWEYRHHQREDGAAAIDWRRSAMSDQLFVRETEWEAANAIYLWRDGSEGMALGSGQRSCKRDRAAVCLIALASLLVRGGERIGVLGETGPARSSRKALEICSHSLVMGPGAAGVVEAPDMPRHARIVLASDFLQPVETWQVRLAGLKALNAKGILLRIIDPAEEDFPFKGRTRFQDPGAADDLLFGRAEAAREDYQALWADHGLALREMARKSGFTLIEHRTDRPATQAVMALYQAISGQV